MRGVVTMSRGKRLTLGVTLLGIVMLSGCVTGQDGTSVDLPSQQATLSIREAKQDVKQIVKDEGQEGSLKQIVHKARQTKASAKDLDKALDQVIDFATEFPTELSQDELLAVYYQGELLKTYAVSYQIPQIHELANWVTTYIKGEMAQSMQMPEETFIQHRDSLIERAVHTRNSLYRQSNK